MIRRIAREFGFFAFFLGAAVVLTWPLAIRLGTAVSDIYDPLLTTWILDWVAHALRHDPMRIFDAPIFYPAKMPLAYSENLIGIALAILPLHLANVAPLTIYNVAMLLGFAHAGYGAFVLGRLVTRSTAASLFAGVFYAFVSFKFDHLAHIQIVWSGWLPFLLAAVVAYFDRATIARAALVFGAFVMNGLTNIHLLLFGSLSAGLALVFAAIVLPWRGWKFWTPIVAALALGCIALMPVLLPYRAVSAEYHMVRNRGELQGGSAIWDDWIRASRRSALYSKMFDPDNDRGERHLFPGLLPLFLLGAAIILTPVVTPRSSRQDTPNRQIRGLRALDVLIVILAIGAWIGATSKVNSSDIPMMLLVFLLTIRLAIRFPAVWGGTDGRSLRTAMASSRFNFGAWAAALWIAIGVLGSFGINSFFHMFLYQRISPFQSIRVPARWAMVTYTGLAVWVAIGVCALLANRRGVQRAAVCAVLAMAAFADVAPRIRWEHVIPEPPPVYRWLKTNRIGPILELPIDDHWGGPFRYLYHATAHRVPIMNGTSGFDPPLHWALREGWGKGPDDEFFNLVERNGARVLLVHADLLSDKSEPFRLWLQRQMAADRIRFIRRFDNHTSGDWLFALNRNFPDFQRWADTKPDGAGNSPQENLRRFQAGEATYTGSTFGRVDTPTGWEQIHRELRVSGWALSPNGIRKATLLINSGRVRIPMERVDRQDVLARYPWYPPTPPPGFVAVVPKRPKGIPRETDFQVELEDGQGKVTRLRDILVTWH